MLRGILLSLFCVAVPAAMVFSGPLTTAACRSGIAQSDADCAARAIKGHPAVQLKFWAAQLRLPLERRFGEAPPELLNYLELDNLKDGFPNHPRTARLEPYFLADMRAALVELPEPVRRLVESKLAGIFVVEDLGGTGWTEQVRDERGAPVAGVVVLDASVLHWRGANGWATWKENTPFKADPRYTLGARIESDSEDVRKNAIQYILLHELGHVIAIGSDIHPSWSLAPASVRSAAAFPFFTESWQIVRAENRYATRFDADFPQRRKVVYYFGPQLPASEMAATYRSLERTNFPTLYASTSPGDDFAESFANYVHVVLMRRPFEVRISMDGRTDKVYGACWEQQRCAAKRAIVERILAVGGEAAAGAR
ncbi:MAG: hypothetical protein ISP90_09015 [Nevskia sp.]|nr:hypothetical protein [Nevskia sp.]